ncbi:MAG: O-antigen ligase family protein [Bacteroidota bacterium]
MIKHLLNNRIAFWVIIFHILLGTLSATSNTVIIGWFFIVILFETPNIIDRNKLNIKLNNAIVYLVSLEVLARMAKTSPFIPYEVSKYVMCALFLYGICLNYNKGYIGLLLLALILPAAFYDQSEAVSNELLIFNIMGPIDLALGVIYFKGQVINKEQLFNLIKLALYPAISVLAFAFIRTPDYDEIDFSLSANFDTTGGFGSNQVSTVLGLGLFLTFLLWICGKIISKNKLFDMVIMMGFVLQGLLTFSRGGMIGGAVAILTLLFLMTFSGTRLSATNKINLPRVGLYLIPAMILGLLVFQFVDSLTGNNLSLRYKGETAGTLAGSKELDLNTFTTNRYEIFLGDVELWKDNVLLGVGAGASKALRPTTEEVPTAAHVELSRLLAEHGLMGLLFFLILLIFPFSSGNKIKTL